MKILLCNLPWTVNKRQGVRAGSRWPHLKIPEEEDYLPYPFFLGYASSLLKKNKLKVTSIDAIAEGLSYNKFLKKVNQVSPNIVFAEVSTPSLKNDLKLLKKIKQDYGCKTIIAGPDMDIFNETFMKKNNFIDFAIIGEYEFTLLDLVKNLKENKEITDIKGLVLRKNNSVIFNQRRPLSNNLEQYPWPDREDFPIHRYHDCPGGIPRPSVQMIASRGCPFLCTFCVWPQLVYGGRNYRTRDIKDVVDEMEHLVKEKGFKSIYFDDDTFNIGKKRMLELSDELKKRNWDTPWAFMGRADLVDEEILHNLSKVGLKAVKYGVESGVQEIVDNAEKNLNLKVAKKNMILTKKLGIKMHLTFTLGLPGETLETIKKTVNFALEINPESVQFSIMTPFPGTRFYNDLKSKGMIVSEEFNNYDGNTGSVIRTAALTNDQLTKAQVYAYQRWHNFKKKNKLYKETHPVKLFLNCVTEHNLAYAIKHTINYLKEKNYSLYKNKI